MTQTYAQSCDKSNTFVTITIKTLLGEGLTDFRIVFLKTTKLLEFPKVGFKLFYSVIVEGKKEFLKKLCLVLIKGMVSTFLVAYGRFFFCLATKNDSLRLFSSISNEGHFPLKSPVIYRFQIFIEIICRCLSVMYNRKPRNII